MNVNQFLLFKGIEKPASSKQLNKVSPSKNLAACVCWIKKSGYEISKTLKDVKDLDFIPLTEDEIAKNSLLTTMPLNQVPEIGKSLSIPDEVAYLQYCGNFLGGGL